MLSPCVQLVKEHAMRRQSVEWLIARYWPNLSMAHRETYLVLGDLGMPGQVPLGLNHPRTFIEDDVGLLTLGSRVEHVSPDFTIRNR